MWYLYAYVYSVGPEYSQTFLLCSIYKSFFYIPYEINHVFSHLVLKFPSVLSCWEPVNLNQYMYIIQIGKFSVLIINGYTLELYRIGWKP